MFCLETDSCRAVSRCFTSAEPKTLSCARSLAQEKDRVLRALFFTIFPEGSENGRILGPAFWCWRTTFELIFGIAQSGRGATISSATCSRRTPKCKPVNACLEHVFVSNNQVKTCCILTKRSANRGGPLWCTRFRRVFRSRKWARKIGQKPGEDVVWQRFSQTRQDTVVGVFPMEASIESATRRLCGLFSASPHPP